MTTPKRAALYARLSVASSEESVSIARQLSSGRRYAEARGWEVALEAVDDGVSATRKAPDERPGWRSILDAADEVDVVIVWKVDRLARRVLDFLNADRTLQERGAAIVAVEDPIDMSTGQGRAFATMLAVFGEMEASAISARSTAARSHMIRLGRTVGGRRPWPYEAVPAPDGVGVVWQPIPERADAVRWAAHELIEGRGSIRKVARGWDERAPLGDGKRWQFTSVKRLLRSPVLAGATINHGAPVRNGDGTMRISPERVILDLSTWRRLQAAMDEKRVLGRAPIGDDFTPSPLVGLLRCGSCGRTLYQKRGNARAVPLFYCGNVYCDAHAAISLRVAEDLVEAAFLREVGDAEVVLPDAPPPAPPAVDLEEVALVVDALEEVDFALTEDLDDTEALRLIQRRRDLRARLAALQDADAAARAAHSVHFAAFTGTGETFATRWAAADSAEAKAAVLALVWAAVEVMPGRPGSRSTEERLRFRSLDDG